MDRVHLQRHVRSEEVIDCNFFKKRIIYSSLRKYKCGVGLPGYQGMERKERDEADEVVPFRNRTRFFCYTFEAK